MQRAFVALFVLAAVRPAIAQPQRLLDMRRPGPRIGEIRMNWGRFPSVSTAAARFVGDVDADGHDDFLVEHPSEGYVEAGTDFGEHAGASDYAFLALVYGGARSAFPPRVDFEAIRHTQFNFAHEFLARFKEPYTGVGDQNGDGYHDFLVADSWVSWNAVERSGLVVLVYGRADFPRDVELFAPETRTTHFVTRETRLQIGTSIGSGGDLNGDGIRDFAIGAWGQATEEEDGIAGSLFVLYGGFAPSEDAEIDVSEVGKTVPGFVLHGAYTNDTLGMNSVAFTPDLNGDGHDDLLVTGFRGRREGVMVGIVWIVYGGRGLEGDVFARSPESFGVEIRGPSVVQSLLARVDALGDVDGDGLNDFLVGADQDGPSGAAHVIFGSRDWPAVTSLDDPDLRTFDLETKLTTTFFSPHNGFSSSVAGIGDFDGDSFGDFVIGAPGQAVRFGNRTGRAFLIFGGPHLAEGQAADLDVGTPTIPGFTFLGQDARARLADGLGGHGDFDGDGKPDFLLKNSFDDRLFPHGRSSVFVVFGGERELDPLALLAVEPASGTREGRYEVVLHGRGFTGGEVVRFGDALAEIAEAATSIELRVVVPASKALGPVDVVIEGAGGAVSRLDGGFRYRERYAFPDLIVDREALDRDGYRMLLYRDFLKTPGFGRGFLGTYFHDLDADGSSDLVIGAPADGPSGLGRVNILFGGERLPEAIGQDETATYGTVIDVGESDRFLFLGGSLAFPGDTDGDGLEDLALALADATAPQSRGHIAVLFGRREWAPALSVAAELAGGRGILLSYEGCGIPWVGAAGDFDGDGRGDVVAGNEWCRDEQAYFRLEHRLADADARWWAVVGGEEKGDLAWFGHSVTGGGDLDGDGHPDLVVNAEGNDGSTFYFVLGDAEPLPELVGIAELIDSGRAVRIRRRLENLGGAPQRVAVLGDFNGDGLADAALGTPSGGRDFHGESYVVFGTPELGKSVKELWIEADSPARLRMDGEFPYDWSGDIAALGDVDGDGLADLGITGADLHNSAEARAYVVFGRRDPPPRLDLGGLEDGGFVIRMRSGHSLAHGQAGLAAGDLDGDGATDYAFGRGRQGELPEVVVIFGRVLRPGLFVRGDANRDGRADISDAVAILGFLFLGDEALGCEDAADVDDNGRIEITDAIALLNHLFLGHPAPPAPYPEAGSDPSADGLECF
jgi:hypothetical protein